MKWKNYYDEHQMTPEQAVSVLKDNDSLILGHAVGEPVLFQRTMAKMAEQFKGITVTHMLYLGSGEYFEPGMEEHFRHNAVFVSPKTRKAVSEGRADYTPTFFTELPKLFRENLIPVDVFAFSCSEPDEHGYVSMGVSCDYGVQALKSAKISIAEVNPNVPRTFGECMVHVSEIDGFMHSNEEIPKLMPPKVSDIDTTIGKYIADLVHDGDCLQLGIGALPDAICGLLGDKKNLGLHTEMISDGVLPLIESGVVNGKCKQREVGKICVTFLMGTQKLYDFIDNNPLIHMLPVDVCNNPYVIAQNDNVVSINSCVEVDLQGQVCAEAIGLRQISGIGGQMDFVRGANLSKGGRSIIALNSTTKDESASKIVPFLTPGAPVTTSRCDVGYIVTEYGVAALRGQTLRERSKRLINIAHPKFRAELAEEHYKRFKEKLEF